MRSIQQPILPTGAPRPSDPARWLALVALAAVIATGPAQGLAQDGDQTSPTADQTAATHASDQQPAPLEEVNVRLTDGRIVSGLLVREQAGALVVRDAGIDTVIPVGSIADLQRLPPVLERYRLQRDRLDDGDIEGRLYLVRWLRAREAYELALQEVEDVLKIDPFSNDAMRLQRWLKAQVELQRRAQDRRRAEREPHDPSDDTQDTGERRRLDGFPVLNLDEINLIRVYEVDLSDPPRMVIARDTIDRLLELYQGEPLLPKTQTGVEALYRRRPAQILDLMFRLQARELYGEVRVLEDPRAMELFRTDVHARWLLNGCATSSCHGGQEAGRLWLNNARRNHPSVVYTNFLILERFRLDDGAPLISHAEPAESPLLQMGLPPERSRRPHPEVGRRAGLRGWRPFFRDEDDIRYRQAVDWIKSLYKPRPTYPIEYTPPVPRGAERAEQAGPAPTER